MAVLCWTVAGTLGAPELEERRRLVGQMNRVFDGSTTSSPDPVQATSLTAGVTALAAGAGHACAIVGGGVRCWGSPYGSTPVPISGLASGVTSLAAGDYHDCAIADGVAWCWGDDGWGALGPGGGGAVTAVPVRLEGL